MKRRIHKFFITNPGYKLLALLLAFALWLVVYNNEDPNKTSTFTIPVTINNEQFLTDQEKTFEIINNSGTVTFAVTAKRSVLDKLEGSDFSATADLSKLTISEDGSYGNVLINVSPNRYGSSVKVSDRTKYLEVSLEKLLTKQFVITANSVGIVKEGYILGNVTVDAPNVIKVVGPESIVEKIAQVRATIDVDGMSQNISDNVEPLLYDVGGLRINSDKLELSNSEVRIRAQILDTKEVSLQFATSGKPAGDNTILGVESSVTSVRVKGTTSDLNKLTAIMIPGSALSVEGATGDITTTIKISEYLPEGITLVDDSKSNIDVVVRILTYGTKAFNIPTTGFTVLGLGDDMNLTYNISAVTVTVAGKDSDLANLQSSDISGTVDLTGLETGSHYVNVNLNLDPEKYAYTTVQVQVYLAKRQTIETIPTSENMITDGLEL